MWKDSGNAENYGVYHREELGKEAERAEKREWRSDWQKITNKGRWRGMKTKKGRKGWTCGTACESLEQHRKMCEAEDKRRHLQMLTSQQEAEEWLLKGKQVLVRTQRDYGVGPSSTPERQMMSPPATVPTHLCRTSLNYKSNNIFSVIFSGFPT